MAPIGLGKKPSGSVPSTKIEDDSEKNPQRVTLFLLLDWFESPVTVCMKHTITAINGERK